MSEVNRLTLIGNGFDLAHGLKTTYKDFIGWYLCKAYYLYSEEQNYNDCLIELQNPFPGQRIWQQDPKTMEDVLKIVESGERQTIRYRSTFMKKVVESFSSNKWVDIEQSYFRTLKSLFSNPNISDKIGVVSKINSEFDYLILKLAEYLLTINSSLRSVSRLPFNKSTSNFYKAFEYSPQGSNLKFLNFNYTETLLNKDYANMDEVIFIHGRVEDAKNNPIIFGYGDESDPSYQAIEDSGENVYLEHIKSFGYFRTDNYSNLLSYIDSKRYVVYIVGHSCGLSDRILLNTIFEHPNCQAIEVFYYRRNDGTDNFKEITQEISRHFKPQNKDLMRRRLKGYDSKNFIPQNVS